MKESFDGLIDHLANAGFFLEEAVEILEKGMIERVLRKCGSNQSESSKILGIHRNTLLRKMVQYGIEGKRVRSKPVGTASTSKRQAGATRRQKSA